MRFFVHGKNTVGFWDNILSLIALYMSESRKCFPNGDEELCQKIHEDSVALYADKTYDRLETYAKHQGST